MLFIMDVQQQHNNNLLTLNKLNTQHNSLFYSYKIPKGLLNKSALILKQANRTFWVTYSPAV